MTVPNLFEAIRAMITDPNIRVVEDSAPLSDPPVLADFPYLVVTARLPTDFTGGSFDDPTLADAEPDAFESEVRLTYAATSGASMQWLVNRVRPFVNREAPQIEGYTVNRLRLQPAFDTEHDRSIALQGGRHPIYAVDRARIIATRTKGSPNG